MKRIVTCLACVGFLCVTAAAYALDAKLTNVIPKRYALLVITGAEPGQPLDKEAVLALAKEQFEKADVKQFQWAVYDKGKKFGDGLRALGEMYKERIKAIEFHEIQENEIVTGKDAENMLCYITTPRELYEAYSDNEVVADDDFKGKLVCLSKIKVPQVAKDAFDRPYISIDIDKYGAHTLHIYLDKKDPFLREIKRGSIIDVRGYPKRFVMQSVMMDGAIVSSASGNSVLLDGKVVPLKNTSDKPDPTAKGDKKK